MYPVRMSFSAVTDRIEALMTNEHYAEALVTSVFTFEKLMKRSLRRAIVARGFSVAQADKLLDRDGFDALVSKWDVFERKHRTISSMVGAGWAHLKQAKGMRNKLVHGNQVFNLAECKTVAEQVIAALKEFHKVIVTDYGVDPWQKQSPHKAALQWRL
jgi:hypothetical protein